MDFKAIEHRFEPKKQTKYEIIQHGSTTVRTIKKPLYEYYYCDCCNKEFKASAKKWQEKEGGILEYPISSFKHIKLAICNSCFTKVLKELDLNYRI